MRQDGLTAIGLSNKKKNTHENNPINEEQVKICKGWI
jgi:hypothetical protein